MAADARCACHARPCNRHHPDPWHGAGNDGAGAGREFRRTGDIPRHPRRPLDRTGLRPDHRRPAKRGCHRHPVSSGAVRLVRAADFAMADRLRQAAGIRPGARPAWRGTRLCAARQGDPVPASRQPCRAVGPAGTAADRYRPQPWLRTRRNMDLSGAAARLQAYPASARRSDDLRAVGHRHAASPRPLPAAPARHPRGRGVRACGACAPAARRLSRLPADRGDPAGAAGVARR